MREHDTSHQDTEETLIPPHYLLLLSLFSLVVAVGVAFTQPTFTVVGWGALGVMALSLVAWALIAPEQARAALTGRTARFGGTSLFVTVVVLAALVALYVLIQGLNVRIDLTERDSFSLNAQSEAAIRALGADPNVPPVRILAFYSAQQAMNREQHSLLFEDYARVSGGKVSYEFIDPDRNPIAAQQYNVTFPGQIVVVSEAATAEEVVDGQSVAGEPVPFFDQELITNAILKVVASGDFYAYFVAVEGAHSPTDIGVMGASSLSNILVNGYGWKVETPSFLDLMAADGPVRLLDPNNDGEVIVLAGGDAPLTDAEVEVIADYLDAGGKLVIFASPSASTGAEALATTSKLSDYLWENFGVRFRNDIVLDQSQSFQNAAIPVAIDFNTNHYITSSIPANGGVIFEIPNSIDIAPTVPETVIVDELIFSGPSAYSKTDVDALIAGDFAQEDSDATGPFVLGAAAHDTQTGAKVVLFGGASVVANAYAQGSGVYNRDVAFNSLIWATEFDQYFRQITVLPTQRPQDTPIFADQQTLSLINLITTFLLPFGVLGVGAFVWWKNRPKPVA